MAVEPLSRVRRGSRRSLVLIMHGAVLVRRRAVLVVNMWLPLGVCLVNALHIAWRLPASNLLLHLAW